MFLILKKKKINNVLTKYDTCEQSDTCFIWLLQYETKNILC